MLFIEQNHFVELAKYFIYSKTPLIATPVYRNSRLLQLVSPVYRNKLYHFFPPLISRRSDHVILKDRREYPSLLNL